MSSATVEQRGNELVIRIVSEAPAAADRLIRLDARTCRAEGFEHDGLRAKVRAGELPVVRIGRCDHVRMSDLLKLPKRRTSDEAAPESGRMPVAPPSPESVMRALGEQLGSRQRRSR